MKKQLEVFVYRNLHENAFSVRDVKTGRVLAHADTVLVRNAEFRVGEKGRQRVLQEKRKNVHAGVRGELVLDFSTIPDQLPANQIRYDPYEGPDFVNWKGKPVKAADMVLLHDGKVFI